MNEAKQWISFALKLAGSWPRRRVIVVDDDPFARREIKRHAEHFGWEVVEAANPVEALRALERNGIRAAFVDINFPGPYMDGFQLRDMIRQDFSHVHVTYLMGSRDSLDKHRETEHISVIFKGTTECVSREAVEEVLNNAFPHGEIAFMLGVISAMIPFLLGYKWTSVGPWLKQTVGL